MPEEKLELMSHSTTTKNCKKTNQKLIAFLVAEGENTILSNNFGGMIHNFEFLTYFPSEIILKICWPISRRCPTTQRWCLDGLNMDVILSFWGNFLSTFHIRDLTKNLKIELFWIRSERRFILQWIFGISYPFYE